MTFPNPLLETHNSAITRVITLGITALTRTPLGFAICLVSNQHSWFYWYLPIAVWFGPLLQWCHLISCSPGDHQGPCCHQAQTRVHSQNPRGTRGVEEAANQIGAHPARAKLYYQMKAKVWLCCIFLCLQREKLKSEHPSSKRAG